MATVTDLPCDGDGVCMVCQHKTLAGETITCKTCVTPWHAACLTVPPKTLGDEDRWYCPDCTDLSVPEVKSAAVSGGDGLVDKIRAIESDASLTDHEKAKRRQELLSGGGGGGGDAKDDKERKSGGDLLGILGDKFNCAICMQLLDRPVSTPCGHNFCLKCFQKWVGTQGKKTCAMCRKSIPPKMALEPRINSAIVMAIRMAKLSQSNCSSAAPKVYHVMHNEDRPDKAFTTTRAKKSGKANACSGKIFVSVPLDHFGPITAENDPTRNRGVWVGDTWEDRMECRQWGAHFPHVAGICGQADCGAQSVALSGGYVDDEDHGDWFLYTGSGGRDLSGNKRTNKLQSFDQTFEKFNEALRVSCRKGYPVRVVRSHKEKRSSYAPQEGVRYDGIYRIEKCWRKPGAAGFKLCRYLFVRCDNDPAPWTSDTNGDIPRSSLPRVAELKDATDITERKGSPAWDYDEQEGRWVWKKPPPESRKSSGGDYGRKGIDGEYVHVAELSGRKRARSTLKKTVKERLLKEFSCLICRNVMVEPLTTPCAHNFCKGCLENAFAGQSFTKERTCGGMRTLRTQKNIMKCPSCKSDISEYLQNPQVNRELMGAIESLQSQIEEENLEDDTGENGDREGDESPEKSTDVSSSAADENLTIPEEENKEKCDADDDGNEKPGNDKELADEDMKVAEIEKVIDEDEKEKERVDVKTTPRRATKSKRIRSEDGAKAETPRRSRRLKKDEEQGE